MQTRFHEDFPDFVILFWMGIIAASLMKKAFSEKVGSRTWQEKASSTCQSKTVDI